MPGDIDRGDVEVQARFDDELGGDGEFPEAVAHVLQRVTGEKGRTGLTHEQVRMANSDLRTYEDAYLERDAFGLAVLDEVPGVFGQGDDRRERLFVPQRGIARGNPVELGADGDLVRFAVLDEIGSLVADDILRQDVGADGGIEPGEFARVACYRE